ncbi:MAG: tetratricopeptide repeat protein [Thioalkalivibrionaceae bacterium]
MMVRIAVATALLALSGCAHGDVPSADRLPWPAAERATAEQFTAATAQEQAARSPAVDQLDNEALLVALLAGEIAVAQGQYAAASEWLGRAAQLSSDPEVAERATRVALLAQEDARARVAAERWRNLAPDNYEALQIDGLLALRRGEVASAVHVLERILERFAASDDVETGPRMVGALLDQADNSDAARDALERLSAQRPDDEMLWQLRVERALRDDDKAVAQDVAAQAVERFPQRLRFRLLQIQALEDSAIAGDMLVTARSDVELLAEAQAVERDALNMAFASWWGLALAAPHDETPTDATRAAALNDGHADNEVAGDARSAVDPDEAERVLREWSGLDDVPDRALMIAGVAALEASRFDLSEYLLARLEQRTESAFDARFLLGRLAETRGEHALAIERYEMVDEGRFANEAALRVARLMVRDPNQRDEGFERLRFLQENDDDEAALEALLVIAQVAREQRLGEPALDMLRRGLLRFPGSPDVLYARGLLYERLDDVDAAERDFRAILDQDPEHIGALNALGYTLADRTERYDEAYDYISRALRQAPDDAAIIDSYGWVLYRLGRLEEAREQLARAHDLLKDGEIAANYAVVLWELGDIEQARMVVEAALEQEPDHDRLLRVRDQIGH